MPFGTELPPEQLQDEAGSQGPALEVIGVSHKYGDVVALDGVSLTARRGEFVTLLGESGSGKTTLLRIIAGLERAASIERLTIGGADVSRVPANRRNATTVFQHYALFPHMSVVENVEYGLRVRHVPRPERRRHAEEALSLVRLKDKSDRRVHQLSGGERQRVALARALVTRPVVLLLDEPLAALDAKLRTEMQVELKELNRKLGTTFIYITHSQEEALSMSDRILLMRRGNVVQEGEPQSFLKAPASRFVADFMGIENLVDATLLEPQDGWARADVAGTLILGRWCGHQAAMPGADVCVAVQAESIVLHGAAPPQNGAIRNVLPCRQRSASDRGRFHERVVDCALGTLTVRIWNGSVPAEPAAYVSWSPGDCSIANRD